MVVDNATQVPVFNLVTLFPGSASRFRFAGGVTLTVFQTLSEHLVNIGHLVVSALLVEFPTAFVAAAAGRDQGYCDKAEHPSVPGKADRGGFLTVPGKTRFVGLEFVKSHD